MTKLFTIDEVKKLVTLDGVLQSVEKTFAGLADGTVINPAKVTLDLGETAPYPPYEGFFNAMPAYIGTQDIAGIKWVGGIAGERKKAGLPFLCGIIVLADPKLGKFLAVMDGAYITELRTGAQTAIALKYILPNKKQIKVGLYGADTSAKIQIQSVAKCFEIQELRVYDDDFALSQKFQKEMQTIVKGQIILCDHPKQACCGDTVIASKPWKGGLIQAEWIEPGTVVFPLGATAKMENEAIIQSDCIIVDHIQQALHRGALKELHEQGKIRQEHITTTIGELVNGTAVLDDIKNKRIVCVPIGTGAMDIAIADDFYQKAVRKGMGTEFDITGE